MFTLDGVSDHLYALSTMSEKRGATTSRSNAVWATWRGAAPVRESIALALRVVALVLLVASLLAHGELARDVMLVASFVLFFTGQSVARLHRVWLALDVMMVAGVAVRLLRRILT